MSQIKSGIGLLAATLLAGCSLAPTYVPPTVAVPVTYKNLGPWTPASPRDALPHRNWWQVYQDPALDQLEETMLARNPTLAIALSHYDQARQLAAEARAAQYPEIDLGASISQNRQSNDRPLRGADQPAVYADDLVTGGFSYELDLWGKIRNEVAAGQAGAEAAAADAASARLSLEAQLADAYFSLRGLDAQTKLLAATASDYAHALRLTEDEHAGGIVSGLDVGQAQTQYDTAQAAETEALAQRAIYENEIATLIGVPASAFSMKPDPDLPTPPVIPVSTPSLLLQRRPDIAAAERQVAAANAEIGVARAAFFPTIALGASGGFQDAGGGVNLLSLPNSVWSVGPALAFTLFDGGLRRAATKRAVDQFNQASEQYRATVLTAFKQVEDNLALSNDLSAESQQQADAVASAARTEGIAMALYEDGATTYLNVVTAQTAELDAKRAELTIATRRLQASVNLVRALGGGWTNPAHGRRT